MYEWQQVRDEYNSQKDERAPYRDYEAVRNKFKFLKGHKKPTGNPTCPPLVRKAKRIDIDIQNGVGVIHLNSEDESSSIHDGQGEESGSEKQASVSDHVSDSEDSPVVVRAALSEASSKQFVVPETMPSILIGDSLENNSVRHVISSEDDVGNDQDNTGEQIPEKQCDRDEERRSEDKRKVKVPHRLGTDAAGLNVVLKEVIQKNREAEKKKKRSSGSIKGVPENPNHSKKKLLSKELQEIDQEIDQEFASAQETSQRNFVLQHKAMDLRHIEEMKRLDQQNALQEKRFELESQRNQSMMMMMFTAITGNRGAIPAPHVQPAPIGGDVQHNP